MASLGKDYGSERHLLTYRRDCAATLDEGILRAMKLEPSRTSLQWLYPDQSGQRGEEFKGLNFLKTDSWAPGTPKALDAWTTFWPTTGTPICWDGVAILHENGQPSRWLLLEAKANHPEFTGAPSRASAPSLEKIKAALGATKRHFAVHRDFDWTGSYYQFANRLTVMRFMNRHGVPTTLIEVLFAGDRFPDGRPCPESDAAWHSLLEARRLTLGLRTLTPDDHVVDVFLNAGPG
jgi:hypothetical protein